MPENIGLSQSLVVRRLADSPLWVRLALSLTALMVGLNIVVRPTMSLDLLATLIGIAAIFEGALAPFVTEASRRWRILTTFAWLCAGIVVLWSPWLTVLALTFVVSFGLIAVGIARILLAFRGEKTLDERIASITFGVAAIIFGVVAFLWRDVSMTVVAVVFGAWLILLGIDHTWRVLRGDRPAKDKKSAGGLRRWVRSITAIASVVAAIAAVGVTVLVRNENAVTDTFYAAPRDIPDQPGILLTVEEFDRGIPPGSLGWRFLYTTTDVNGDIAVASAIGITPDTEGLKPVVTWAHSTTGVSQQCAPSLQEAPFHAGGVFTASQVIREGWAMVMPDYPGLGTQGNHPYLLGEPTAQSVLDATRAAYSLIEMNISHTTVVWGHSQGGQAALWASQIAAKYAPELDVRGVAAVSPASDLPKLVETLDSVRGGIVFASFVFNAYEQAYPDIDATEYLRPGSEVAVREYPKQCLASLGQWGTALSVAARFVDPQIFRTDPNSGALGHHLRANTAKPSEELPLLLVAGSADPLINPSIQTKYVQRLCRAGVPVDYRTIKGADHISMLYSIHPFSSDLRDWTAARFLGEPAASTCT